jgi:hypothetical protein
MERRGGEEAQGIADPKNTSRTKYASHSFAKMKDITMKRIFKWTDTGSP